MSSWEEFRYDLGLTSLIKPTPVNFHTAIQINSCQDDGPSELSQWPSHMLKEIMSLCSDIMEMPDKIKNKNTLANISKNGLDDFEIENLFCEDDESGLIHPMDVFLYLFFSCDGIFRQSFVSHIAKSQLSVPLIAIDPQSNCPTLYLFALQTLYKDCYTDQNYSKSFPVVEEKLPIISFIRLGECEDSKKSLILNEIIGTKHSYFFNRNSRDSIRKTLFLKGTVEVAWYFPGMKHQIINELLVLLNLRGDAFHYPKQVQFMANISTLLCLFIPSYSDNEKIEKMKQVILNLKENYNDKLIFLVYKSQNQPNCLNMPKCVINEKKKITSLKLENIKQASENVCKMLVKSLESVNKLIIPLQETQNIANQYKIVVDNNDVILHSNNNLQDIIAYLRNSIESHKSSQGTTPLALAKKHNLPLQGKPWKDWAKARCDLFLGKTDQSDVNLEEYIKQINLRMIRAREDQLQLLCDELYIFVKKILKLNHNEVILEVGNCFFANWKLLQNELNLIALEYLPILYEQYKMLLRRSFINDESVEKKEGEMMRNNAKQDLLRAANVIIESSFGIEHIFRELGQVYETYLHFSHDCGKLSSLKKSLGHDVINLPEIVAKLILDGHSFEIMDGDVNHVPHDWVRDVIMCLSNLIGIHKKMFVLTILGIQSSGKSTLLNTMFGVNFSVSSGRCTRGVFMQIIPIDEKLTNTDLGYDYLVLLDTEGLRAAELLGNYCYIHDNQLATFVIGIGDLTLINIFGENLTEMQEIIQITVIAFMRMNISVHKRPKCIFVHQNVGDIHAGKNLMFARSNLINTLNEATKIAAIQEKKDTVFKQFSEVIEFDSESDVFYFPSLHDGEPPMARVSAGYSKCAKKLKNRILTIPPNRRKEFLSINDWNSKIHLIWESILKENFAFSYRNILELHCRFELDSALCEWSSEYAHSMLTYKSNVINILLNSGSDELENKFQHIKSELLQCAEEQVFESQNNILNYFFSQSENKNIYQNWKSATESYFNSKRNYERERVLSDCDHVVNVQRQKFELDSEFQKYKKDIVSKAVPLFKEVYSDNAEEIEASFENKFEKLFADSSICIRPIHIQPANIVTDCQKAIVESHYLQSMSILSEKRELIAKLDDYKSFGSSDFLSFYSKLDYQSENPYYIEIDMSFRESVKKLYINVTSILRKNIQKTKYNDHFEILLGKFTDNVDEFITKNNEKNINYNSEFYFLLICFIYKDLEDYNKEQRKAAKHCIELTNNFIFDFIFYKCCTAITQFEKLQQSFIERTNLHPKLNQLKCELKQMFLDSLKNVGVEYTSAGKLTQILIQPMKNFLTNFAIQTLLLNFKSDQSNVTIFKSRSALQLAILKDLVQKRKFSDYIQYIKFPIRYLNLWIINKLTNYSNDQNALNDILPTLSRKIDYLCKTYIAATQKANLESESFRDRWPKWISCFHYEIISEICELKRSYLEILNVYSISNYENFSQFFAESLQNEIANCDWSAWLTEIFSNTKLPSHTITDSLLECKALCPFCNEPCRLSVGEHEHYCGSFHRPQGINGMHYKNSEIITTEECNISLKQNNFFWYKNTCYKYEDYRTINENFRSWTILADDALESKYWQWVLFNFQQEFLDLYNIKYNAKIEGYSYLTEKDIIRDIERHYQNYTFKHSS